MSGFLTPIDTLHGVGRTRGHAPCASADSKRSSIFSPAPTRYDVAPPVRRVDDLAPKSPATLCRQGPARAPRPDSAGGGHFLDLVLKTETRDVLGVRFWNRGWLIDRIAEGDRVALSGALDPAGTTFAGTAITRLDDAGALDAWLAHELSTRRYRAFPRDSSPSSRRR
jgi:hypothetical protein